MKGYVSKYLISNWYYIGVLLLMAISSYYAMPDIDNQTDVGTGFSYLSIVSLAAIQLPLLLFILGERLKGRIRMPIFILYYGVYFCWMTAITLSTDNAHNIFGLTVLSMTVLVFLFSLITSYFRARYSELDTSFYIAVLLIFICIVYQYYNLYSIANQARSENSHIAVSYFPLFILPILLLSSSRTIRIIAIAITSIVIVSSAKRGGFVALGASLLVYELIKQFVEEKSHWQKIIMILIVFLLMGSAIYYLYQQEDNNIIERMLAIKDDGGSDRDVLWADTFYNIQNRDMLSRIVGDGYRSSQKVSKYHLQAHNDILEIWYDFGGIGLFFYGIAFLSLCIYTWRLFTRKSKYAPHLAMTITFYFIFTMISTVILYFWMTLLMFSVGIISGLADREQEKKIQITKS